MSISQKESISTHEIVTIAILSSLGGAMSTFIGYLGNMINLALGVPFGAGQFIAGFHVFWLVLIRVIVPRKGAGIAGGLLKGFVELFTGSTHGIVIVIVSLVQGIIIDATATVSGNPRNAGIESRISWWIGAGIATCSNVITFQTFYFAGAPWVYIIVISILAFCSGVIFAGYFAWETLEFLDETGILSNDLLESKLKSQPKSKIIYRNLPAIIFVLFLSIGSTYYIIGVARFFNDPHSCNVQGLVKTPFTFHPSMFSDQEVTIEAELNGAYTHLPLTNYTGVLISTIIEYAEPLPESTGVRIIARDGYTIPFPLDDIMSDSCFLLTETDEGLWLIAGNYDGSLWVQMVSELQVY